MKKQLLVVGALLLTAAHAAASSAEKPDRPSLIALMDHYLAALARHDPSNSYYDAIVQDDGSVAPFADECQRRENGGTSANDQEQTPEEAKKDDFSVFRKMRCGEQLSTGVMSYITDINRRRLLAVDEEMGLVFGYSIFVHDGLPKVMKIIGVPGITERPSNWGPFDLPAAHIFKIRGGKIYEIEAIGYMPKHGIRNGWE